MSFKTIILCLSLLGSLFSAPLFEDDFSADSLSRYTVVTRGTTNAPAQWTVTGGRMVQSSNVYDVSPSKLWLGTIAAFGDSTWSRVRLSLDLMSSDDDGLGVVFRFINDSNYCQFRWDKQQSHFKIEKLISGATSVRELAALPSTPYTTNLTYHLELLCSGSAFQVTVSGGNFTSPRILRAFDTTFSRGRLGLYAWGCQSAYFDNILVNTLDGDTSVPPPAIGDLAAAPGLINGRVQLSWTAPPDDGILGRGALYDIRYSDFPMNSLADFLAARSAADIPAPDSPGVRQQLFINRLTPGKTYYFRIRTCDEFRNWGALSNSASGAPFYDPTRKSWFKGQIHCHTTNSDGVKTPAEVAALYRAAGYDFLAISDHRFVTPTDQFRTPDFLTFPNDELNNAAGHVNALNVSGGHPAGTTATLQGMIDLAAGAGALAQINHPDYSHLTSAKVLATTGVSLMEVMQPNDRTAYDMGVWDSVLSAGRQIFGTGTDDAHRYNTDFNYAWIEVYADSLRLNEILNAIRNGDFIASNGAGIDRITKTGRTLSVESRDGVRLDFIGKHGKTLKTVDSSHSSFTLPDSESYVRARVTNAAGKIACTQAYFPNGPITSGESPVLLRKFSDPVHVFPNPFQGNPIIRYTISGHAVRHADLSIYNLAGNKIRTLVNGTMTAGIHQVRWDGCDQNRRRAANGGYLCVLTVNREKLTRIIIKDR